MIRPRPFKVKCPKCGKTKIIAPKSDALLGCEFSPICEKCNVPMQRCKFDFFDKLLGRDTWKIF